MEIYECGMCGEWLEETDFAEIAFNGVKYPVCPTCLSELLNTDYRLVNEQEVEEARAEWDADERYDESRTEGRI